MVASKRALSILTSKGELPPLEIAITNGLRSTTAGMMKSQLSVLSLTLTIIPAAAASSHKA
jgi:hypothetical protein